MVSGTSKLMVPLFFPTLLHFHRGIFCLFVFIVLISGHLSGHCLEALASLLCRVRVLAYVDEDLTDLSWVPEAREDIRSWATAPPLISRSLPGVGSLFPSSLARTGGLPQFCFHCEGRCSASFTFSCLPSTVAGVGVLTSQGGLLYGERQDNLRLYFS